jgi:hypothetical protein
MTMHLRFAAMAVALAAAAACAKSDTARTDSAKADTTTPAAVPAPAPTTLDVGDIDMGRHVGADKKISDKTDDFAPKDTIFASIHTKGGPPSSQVMARWTFQDGKVVKEETQSVSGTSEGDTEFHISNPKGWPTGKYTVHILVDGKEAKTKDVTVK